ncbi:sirohydrochlorin chelatase [Psychromicrobium sp. YIM B11713]|uniref:sirohydrochlorin chelatase n=1 Tax=Psychromicrobium sp. YIM B11713 TaxID=3145233 RepID=UPI00374EFED1
MKQPILIACSHGTDDPQARTEVAQLRRRIAELRPALEVREAYVDVQSPALPEVLSRLPEGVPAVVVPLLLSVGYHVEVDIAQAVATRPLTRAAAPLGPDSRLAELLARRVAAVMDSEADWGVVFAAAGSSKASAAVAIEEMAGQLRALLPCPVRVGYGAGAEPRVPAAVQLLRQQLPEHAKVAVASYLLAPGYFHRLLSQAGADQLAAPLLPDPVLAQIALDRFDAVAG